MRPTRAFDDLQGCLEDLAAEPSIAAKQRTFTALSYQPSNMVPSGLKSIAEVLQVDITNVEAEYSLVLREIEQSRAHPKPAAATPRIACHAQFENRTDSGNACRLVALYGDRLRYCHEAKRWYIWNGAQWKPDEEGAIYQYAHSTAKSIYNELTEISDSSERKAHFKHALYSESERGIRAMISLAQNKPGIPIRREDLDAHKFKLNLLNGVLDLETGELFDHDPDLYFSKILPWRFDIKAEAPRFMQFLHEITGGDPDLLRYLQLIFGYCLSASSREQVFFIFYGPALSGKSTCVKILLKLLGPWGAQTPPETLVMRKGRGGFNDLARLADRRVVAAIETEEGERLAESLIKALSGEDRIAARHHYQEFFEYEAGYKVIITTNHKPIIADTSGGIWRRIRLVPFSHTIPEEEKDGGLIEKLEAEMPGILVWALKGCFEWLNMGKLETPEIVKIAILGYRQEQDQIMRFLGDSCKTGDVLDLTLARKLYNAYRNRCIQDEEPFVSEKRFAQRLVELGYKREHGMVGNFYRGIRLLDQETDER